MAHREDGYIGFRRPLVGEGRLLALAVVVAACGRSDNVGWADREAPDSAERAEQRAAAVEELKSSPMGLELQARSYQQLAEALDPIRDQAMEDPEISAIWESLAADVEAKVVSESQFHRGLVERREVIESLIGADAVPPDTLTEAQKAELARHRWNIQVEMTRARNTELRKPEFFARLRAFRAALFDKMRELAPSRADEIDRMQELEEEIIEPAPATPAPGM